MPPRGWLPLLPRSNMQKCSMPWEANLFIIPWLIIGQDLLKSYTQQRGFKNLPMIQNSLKLKLEVFLITLRGKALAYVKLRGECFSIIIKPTGKRYCRK